MANSVNILVVEHSPDAPSGHLGELILDRGWFYDTCRPAENYASANPLASSFLPTDADGYQALVVLGGPMDADDEEGFPHYQALFDLIDAFAKAEKPVLGLCLGAQLLSRHYGGSLSRIGHYEIGLKRVEILEAAQDDLLLQGLDTHPWMLEWHQDQFSFPAGVTPLISREGYVGQAFKAGSWVYAFQGHPEATLDTVRNWIFHSRKEMTEEEQSALPGVTEDIRLHWKEAQVFAQIVLNRWLDLVQKM